MARLHRRPVILLLTLALSLTLAGPASAQWAAAGGGLRVYGLGPRLGENIHLALQNRDVLGLSSNQIAQLEDLQAGLEREVTPVEQEIDALRAGIRGGDVAYAEGQARLEDLLVRFETLAEPYRAGVAETLTPEQHATLQRMLYDSRPYVGRGYGRQSYGYGYGYGAGYGAGYGYRPGWGAGRGPGRWPARGGRRVRW